MLHRLCLAFGAPFIHPDLLAKALTERQVQDWIDFYTLEPWGCHAEDYRAALIAWAAIGPPTNRKGVSHYAPQWGGKDPLSAEEYKERARAIHGRAAAG